MKEWGDEVRSTPLQPGGHAAVTVEQHSIPTCPTKHSLHIVTIRTWYPCWAQPDMCGKPVMDSLQRNGRWDCLIRANLLAVADLAGSYRVSNWYLTGTLKKHGDATMCFDIASNWKPSFAPICALNGLWVLY